MNGDRERLLQVLSNLLGNASKFAPAEGHITARAIVMGGWAHCSISDDGPGIAPAELDQVFEPYWSGDSAKGTGLGLSIVKGIVEAHGGTTSIESKPGVGTTIVFVLPLTAGDPILSGGGDAQNPLPATEGGVKSENADRPVTIRCAAGNGDGAPA